MAHDDLRNLPPEERIKLLKKLEEEKKKEIEEAEKQIQESEKELTVRDNWKRKVPIPEVTKEDLENIGEEGKEMVRLHRGLATAKADEETTGKETVPTKKKEERLEETIAREQVELPPEARGVEYGIRPEVAAGIAYTSERPTEDLYKDVLAWKSDIEERGYITKEDVGKARYFERVAEERMESGYASAEERSARTSLIQMVSEGIQHAYKTKISPTEQGWYKSRG